MPEALLIGPPTVVAQTTIYALPARAVYLTAAAVLQLSNDPDFGSTVGVTSTTAPTLVAAGFARCTTGSTIVCLKAV